MKDFTNELNFIEETKDNKLNLSNVLRNTGGLIPSDLVAATIVGILYAKDSPLLESFIDSAKEELTEELIKGAKAAGNIMNMNNIYYRGKHYLGDNYNNVQAGLRMGIYTKHGIDKKYFEFISLAVSFINGCEFCVASHASLLEKEGMSKEQIHEALRIAAIVNTLRKNY
jgi:alkyl hydroperoxide reductase subunit D